jgi:hypothetical protein
VFAPILWNSLLIVLLIESTAVNIPTKAMMPMAIISTVSMVRSKFDFIAFTEILILSNNNPLIRIAQI